MSDCAGGPGCPVHDVCLTDLRAGREEENERLTSEVERLKTIINGATSKFASWENARQATLEIVRLKAEVERLRDPLHTGWAAEQDSRLAEAAAKFGKGSEAYRLHEELLRVDRAHLVALQERNEAREEVERLNLPENRGIGDTEIVGALKERDRLRADLKWARREVHRWQHGNQVEGDYVCEAMAENVALRAEVERLRIDADVMQSTHEGPDSCPLWYDGCNCRRGVEDILDARAELEATKRTLTASVQAGSEIGQENVALREVCAELCDALSDSDRTLLVDCDVAPEYGHDDIQTRARALLKVK